MDSTVQQGTQTCMLHITNHRSFNGLYAVVATVAEAAQALTAAANTTKFARGAV